MNTFTPGPWTATEGIGSELLVRWKVVSGRHCVAGIALTGTYESEANARAVAALPDLVAALRNLVNDIDNSHGTLAIWPVGDPHLTAARAALAKAGAT